MRTTLTLEPAVAERIGRRMKAEGESMKSVVNEALREGLRVLEQRKDSKPFKFVVKPHSFGLLPGINPDKLGQFLDELDVEEYLEKARRHEKTGK